MVYSTTINYSSSSSPVNEPAIAPPAAAPPAIPPAIAPPLTFTKSGFKPVSNFADLTNINFDLKINGKQLQVGNTSLMIYSFADIIAIVSKYMTLEPGDLIFTGTPAHGTGPIFKGDRLQATIEGELLLDFKMV